LPTIILSLEEAFVNNSLPRRVGLPARSLRLTGSQAPALRAEEAWDFQMRAPKRAKDALIRGERTRLCAEKERVSARRKERAYARRKERAYARNKP
jgi:hypothetical protein